MKRLLISLTLIISANAWAEENKMILLDDFMKERENISEPDALYLSYRCLSYYYNLSGILSLGGKREIELNEEVESLKLDFINLGWSIWQLIEEDAGRETNFDAYEDNMGKSIKKMAKSYQNETNASWNNTGSYFNDYIKSDGNTCKIIHENFYLP